MRNARQKLILELIAKDEIDTQEKLSFLLKKSGVDVTQATISRDIKELQLVKTLTSQGKYKYIANAGSNVTATDGLIKIFRETILGVTHSGNMMVIKTMSGCANAVAESIDTSDFPSVLGTIAGDNTIFLLIDENTDIHELVQKFSDMIN